ncbi:MAG: branched-chain amino acid ABC transporter ATP-binding protein/permease [Phycisphaerales bacterium]|nr:branched-chain amino acid ABC transporter ATP-binding protein/permease [Phycisphaerales bacterium]
MKQRATNLAILLAAFGVPLLGQAMADRGEWSFYTQGILYKIALNITLAVGLSLIIGFAGQFSLGQAGFMSLGAFFSAQFTGRYVMSWVSGMDPAWLDSGEFTAVLLRTGLLVASMSAGMLVAVVAAIIIGLPTLRLRGDYLAIATLGFGEITYNLLLIYLQQYKFDTACYIPSELAFMSRTVNIASSWTVALLAILVARNLVSSTCGRALPAIREDEIAAGAVGIRTTRYKLLAFVVGSMLASWAGTLEAHQTATVNPGSYRFDRSIEMIVPVVLGGSGSLTGSVLAAGIFTYLLEKLRDLPSGMQQYRTIVYAAVLVLIMVLRPQGLLGRWELGDLLRRLRGNGPSAGKSRAIPQSPAKDDGRAAASPSHAIVAAGSRARGAGDLLACEELTIRFGGLTAVSCFNMRLGDGEIVGLIGPNGAGKTTCFNMITGVYQPTSGKIALGGMSVLGCNTARINHRGIARTFQNIRLFAELSVLDNVRVAMHAHLRTGIPAAVLRTAKFYREEGEVLAASMRLLDIFGLRSVVEEDAGSLPYGAQRRLEIARALATRPRLLCLDEPAAGMNPVEKQDLMNLIRRLRTEFDVTILLIEHDMKVVMGVCERILVLDHGETIATGKPEEIRDNPKVIEAYLGEPMKV